MPCIPLMRMYIMVQQRQRQRVRRYNWFYATPFQTQWSNEQRAPYENPVPQGVIRFPASSHEHSRNSAAIRSYWDRSACTLEIWSHDPETMIVRFLSNYYDIHDRSFHLSFKYLAFILSLWVVGDIFFHMILYTSVLQTFFLLGAHCSVFSYHPHYQPHNPQVHPLRHEKLLDLIIIRMLLDECLDSLLLKCVLQNGYFK